jgi:hypothetical protein
VSVVLEVHQRPVAAARPPGNICLYEAASEIGGRVYTARSRRGALFALARALVAAGITDQPVIVTHEGLRGGMTYRSLRRMAGLTIKESGAVPVRLARYEGRPEFMSRGPGKAFHGAAADAGAFRIPTAWKQPLRRVVARAVGRSFGRPGEPVGFALRVAGCRVGEIERMRRHDDFGL